MPTLFVARLATAALNSDVRSPTAVPRADNDSDADCGREENSTDEAKMEGVRIYDEK